MLSTGADDTLTITSDGVPQDMSYCCRRHLPTITSDGVPQDMSYCCRRHLPTITSDSVPQDMSYCCRRHFRTIAAYTFSATFRTTYVLGDCPMIRFLFKNTSLTLSSSSIQIIIQHTVTLNIHQLDM